MGSHRCQRPMCSGKHLLKGWMPSSIGSMESSCSKTPCAQFCPQPTVPPSPQPRLPPAARPRAPASAPRPFLAQPLARTPAPPSMPRPTNAGDAMVVDHARAPGVVRTCFQCGQAGHMVRECPLPDTRPQIPRPQVRAVESQGHSLEDCENEIVLLRDRLELYEKERKAPVEEQDFEDEAQ